MKNNKGFTLVELLAVIIVLAIIMVIAIPTVTNVMGNARRNAMVLEAEKMLTNVQTRYMADVVLANQTTDSKCVYYQIDKDFGGSTGTYKGTVWAIFGNTNEVIYGISIQDTNYQIIGFTTTDGYPDVSEVKDASSSAPLNPTITCNYYTDLKAR